MARQIARES